MKAIFLEDYYTLPKGVCGIGNTEFIREGGIKICAGCEKNGGNTIELLKNITTGKFEKVICDAKIEGNHCSSVNIESDICIIKLD